MKIKFLTDSAAPVSRIWDCGDVCRCQHIEWEAEVFLAGDEADAVNGDEVTWGQAGVVDVSDLKFGKDYTIIEFP